MEDTTKEIIKKTLKEEIANSITHGIGFFLSIAGLIILVYKASVLGTAIHVVSCSFYGVTLLLLYIMSTLYHAITHPIVKKIFRRLDHISIYLLIFGTYMPLTLVALNGVLGWWLFGLECALCVIGITFKAVFGPKLAVVSTLFYLFMGCIVLFVIKPIYFAISAKGIFWIFAGGFFYTLGILFFAIDSKMRYSHAIWHLFVLTGSICHFFSILFYVIPIAV